MAKPKNGGLGRGLDSIFLDNEPEMKQSTSVLRISEIEPNPNQPRKEFDASALAELADSIATHGLIQPIVVRAASSDGFYQIIAGERRWRASKMAGLNEVPVVIMDADDKKASELSLIENIQRRDLNAVEEASAIKVLLEQYEMTQEELASAIGKSRSALANTVRLLDLPDPVIAMLKEDRISAGHARALLGLKYVEDVLPTAKKIEEKDLNVREAEELVRACNKMRAKEAKGEEEEQNKPVCVDYIAELASRMSQRMGRTVKITGKGKKRRLELSFEDDEDLDILVKKLCGENIFDE